MSNKGLEIDGAIASEIRDKQGELLSVEGADISELEAGRGLYNDNHSSGMHNSLGVVTTAKKIFSKADCTDDRHHYYWEKIKAPYIYAKGYLHSNEDHPNAKAAAAIIKNVHNNDCPLKVKCSVEGGIIQRGIKDPRELKRTKITQVAITFVPANDATLIEPISLTKSMQISTSDMKLMKSVMHLAKTNVPSFRAITRDAQAATVKENLLKINAMREDLGLSPIAVPDKEELVKSSIAGKIERNIYKIEEMTKALTAGYGGAGTPTEMTGGSVLQRESVEKGGDNKDVALYCDACGNKEMASDTCDCCSNCGKKYEALLKKSFKYITCDKCGNEGVFMKSQRKCRACGSAYSFSKLAKYLL